MAALLQSRIDISSSFLTNSEVRSNLTLAPSFLQEESQRQEENTNNSSGTGQIGGGSTSERHRWWGRPSCDIRAI